MRTHCLIDSNIFILTFCDSTYLCGSKIINNKPFLTGKLTLIDSVLNAYAFGDSTYNFYKYKDMRVKKIVFNSLRFELIRPPISITGVIYFYKNIPVKVIVKKDVDNHNLLNESIVATKLYVDHILIPLE